MAKSTVLFDCTVYKVQTLADGGLRVTLDLPETATDAAKMLMDWRNEYIAASLSIKPSPSDGLSAWEKVSR